MIKNPIQAVTNKLQYRAIGIVKGVYKPHDIDQLNRGYITDDEGKILDAVVLGKALTLIKNHINLSNRLRHFGLDYNGKLFIDSKNHFYISMDHDGLYKVKFENFR